MEARPASVKRTCHPCDADTEESWCGCSVSLRSRVAPGTTASALLPLILQGHNKFGRFTCEIKLLNIPVGHEHAIFVIFSAGGKRVARADGSVRRKLEADFTVSANWDECILDQNERSRIGNQVNLARLETEFGSEIDPFGSVCRVGGRRVKLDAFEI